MKNNGTIAIRALIATFIIGMMAVAPAKAQLEDIEAFLESGSANATALTRAYLKPLPSGLSTSLNSGWTTKAKSTKTLGFSLQFRVAAAVVPSSGQTFDAREIGLTNVNITGTSSNTISGKSGSGQVISDTGGNFSFTLPGGTGFNYVPAPMAQLNVGLVKSTDLTIRLIPEVEVPDFGNFSMFGAGLKVGVNEFLPGGGLIPVDISVMGAFSKIDLNADLAFNAGATDQVVETNTNTFVLNALVGKTLPFISAYAGVGYQKGSFELNILGDYDLGAGGVISDPVSYTDDSDVKFHALAGLQFKLGPLRIYAEGTASEYVTANIGVGLGLRN